MNILKTFEIFNRQAVKFLTDKVLNIFLVETKDKTHSGVSVNTSANVININVVNRPKTYNLLMYTHMKYREKYENKKRSIH
ncbi:MAG: hypothetical protein PHX18_02165 [Candidatus Gastranaerophilales bacterium]|nr:hypothetical protein [Candidatus Gastranaerophilales bacterium]